MYQTTKYSFYRLTEFPLHSFIHPLRVYYELIIWPAPSWLDSSVGRALQRHRRGHGFESRSSLSFFQAFFSQLLKLRSNCEDLSSIWSFIRSSKYMYHIFTFRVSIVIYLTRGRLHWRNFKSVRFSGARFSKVPGPISIFLNVFSPITQWLQTWFLANVFIEL